LPDAGHRRAPGLTPTEKKKNPTDRGCILKDSTTRHKNTRSFLRTVGVFNVLILC
jgi:hypothetical protein